MNKVKMSTLSKEEQEREVAKNPYNIQYVREQTEELCKLAVQIYPYTIKYVKDQTEELCKLAVENNGYAIEYVREQTPELCKIAVEEEPYALEYVNLEFITQEILDICKGRTYDYDWNDYNDYFQSLNAVEITKKELEELLGYKIKIIKEEK